MELCSNGHDEIVYRAFPARCPLCSESKNVTNLLEENQELKQRIEDLTFSSNEYGHVYTKHLNERNKMNEKTIQINQESASWIYSLLCDMKVSLSISGSQKLAIVTAMDIFETALNVDDKDTPEPEPPLPFDKQEQTPPRPRSNYEH